MYEMLGSVEVCQISDLGKSVVVTTGHNDCLKLSQY